MSNRGRNLRRCQAISVLLVFAWQSEAFAVCVMSNHGVEGHAAVVGAAYPQSRGC